MEVVGQDQAVSVCEQTGQTALAASVALEAAETAWQGRKVTATRRWVDAGISLARTSGDQECLRKLLILGATVANLRGEYGRAKTLWSEAADLAGTLSQAPEPAAIGGTLLTGGYGSAIGAAIGALIMAMSQQGISFAGWNTDWRFVFLGAILLIAVYANGYVRRVAEAAR